MEHDIQNFSKTRLKLNLFRKRTKFLSELAFPFDSAHPNIDQHLAHTYYILSSLDDNGSFINGQGLRVMGFIPLETVAMSKTNRLSIPAVRQILARLAKGEKEEDELVEKLEDSCLRYDHDKKGVMGPVLQCLNVYCDF